MDCREPLKTLRNELLGRGLPGDYVERVIGELADHAEDIASETCRTSTTQPAPASPCVAARLGDPVELAQQISDEFQRRTFLGRHPLLTFALLPGGAMIVGWLLALVGIALLVDLILTVGGKTEFWCWVAAISAGVLAYGMTFAAPLVVGWWALAKAKETARRLSWTWATTSVLLIACLALRISIARTDDGLFVIDCPDITRWAFSCLLCLLSGEPLPTELLGRLMENCRVPIAYLAQVAILIGVTAIAKFRHRRSLMLLIAEPFGHGKA